MKTKWPVLEQLLRERLSVIADLALRDRDPAAHLDKLRSVSMALDQEFQNTRAALPSRLGHFMQQSSYQKALAFIEESGSSGGSALAPDA